jgi:hypothetical protein
VRYPDELKIFGSTPKELIELMAVLASSSYRSGNCICIPKQILIKNLKKTGKTSRESINCIDNLCYGKRQESLVELSRSNSQEKEEWKDAFPFLELHGSILTSLWFMHYLIVNDWPMFSQTAKMKLKIEIENTHDPGQSKHLTN